MECFTSFVDASKKFMDDSYKTVILAGVTGSIVGLAVNLINSKAGIIAAANCAHPLVAGTYLAACILATLVAEKVFPEKPILSTATGFLPITFVAVYYGAITLTGAGVVAGVSIATLLAARHFGLLGNGEE